MREIKFRAWHKKEKWMAAVSMCDFILGVFIFTGEAFAGEEREGLKDEDHTPAKTAEVEDLEIMQFTGFHADNCVEVFDGDIVKLTHDEEYSNDSVLITVPDGKNEWEFVGKVLFNSHMYLVESKGIWIPLSDIDLFNISIKVIGNIYEHPELLNQ